MRVFIVALFLLVSSSLALAQERREQIETPPSTTVADTRVDVNQDSGTLTIVVKGRPVALFDERGLHVRGDIDYSGKLADTGRTASDQRFGEGEAP